MDHKGIPRILLFTLCRLVFSTLRENWMYTLSIRFLFRICHVASTASTLHLWPNAKCFYFWHHDMIIGQHGSLLEQRTLLSLLCLMTPFIQESLSTSSCQVWICSHVKMQGYTLRLDISLGVCFSGTTNGNNINTSLICPSSKTWSSHLKERKLFFDKLVSLAINWG